MNNRWAWSAGYRINIFKAQGQFNNKTIPFYTDYCQQLGSNLVFFPVNKARFSVALTGGILGLWWHRNYARDQEIHHPDVITIGYQAGPRFDWISNQSWILSLSALAQNDLDENPIGTIQFSFGKRW